MSRPEYDREQGHGDGHHDAPSRAVVPAPPAAAVRPWSEAARSSTSSRQSKPVALSTTPDPIALLVALRRRWVMALSLGILVTTTVGLLAYFLIPQAKFVAAGVLRIKAEQPRFFATTNETVENHEQFRETQKFMLTTSDVLGAALRDPKVSRLRSVKEELDAKAWLRRELKFRTAGEFLEVSMAGEDPTEVEIVVNAVIDSYLKEVVEKNQRVRLDRLNALKAQVETFQGKLKLKRKYIRDLSEGLGANNPVAIQAAQTYNQTRLADLKLEASTAATSRLKAATRLKVLLQNVGENNAEPQVDLAAGAPVQPPEVSEATVTEAIERDQNMAQLRADLEKAEGKLAGLTRVIRSKSDPAVVAARRSIEAAQARIDNRINQVREQLSRAALSGNGALPPGPGAPTGNTVRDEIATLRMEETYYKELEETYNAQVAALEGQNKNAAIGALDLEKEKAEIATVEEIAKKMTAEIEAVELELNAPDRVTYSNRAEAPKVKDNSKHLKICLALSLGAFVFTVFSVSFWEFRARRVNSVDEVVTSLGLNLVGALPALPTRKVGRRSQTHALEDRAWQNMLVESVDATRTMLLHMSRVEGLHSVMICSAMKGEGKTSLSVHLATSLARAGQRTLLIDCDLRSPSVNKLYDLAVEPGLCEYLRGEVGLEDVLVNVIRQAPAGELDLIPAGRYDAIALQVLARDGVRNLIDAVKGTYDFVIVDSAPILPVADTLLLSQQVDAVLFSVLRDVSRLNHVHAAHERVSNLGVRILGAVVNGAPRTSTYGMYPYS